MGNLDHVRTLISYGADFMTKPKGSRASHILQNAISRGRNLDVVRFLIEKGANLTGSFPYLLTTFNSHLINRGM